VSQIRGERWGISKWGRQANDCLFETCNLSFTLFPARLAPLSTTTRGSLPRSFRRDHTTNINKQRCDERTKKRLDFLPFTTKTSYGCRQNEMVSTRRRCISNPLECSSCRRFGRSTIFLLVGRPPASIIASASSSSSWCRCLSTLSGANVTHGGDTHQQQQQQQSEEEGQESQKSEKEAQRGFVSCSECSQQW